MTLTFTPATGVHVDGDPSSVTMADVNGDGRIDLLTADSATGTVSVRLGDGTGGFSGTTEVAVGDYPVSVTAADVNGDGRIDLLTANVASGTVSVRLGDGRGGFSGTTEVVAGDETNSVTMADVNGDGRIDLLAANISSSTVSVRLGDGSGGFSGATEVMVGSYPYSVATADVNGDGRIDLLTANAVGNTISVRLGDGSGGFIGDTEIAVGRGPINVIAADVNRDGRLDLLTANYSSHTVSVRLGDGNGGFGGDTEIAVRWGPSNVIVADVNGDGRLDLLTTNYDSNTVSVRHGDGTGGFSGTTEIMVEGRPASVATADVNRDGRIDLLVANQVSGTVSVLLGGETVAATEVIATTSRSGPLTVSDVITLTLVTDEPISATGTPRLTLGNGASATYAGLDGSGRPQFSYTVAAGDDIANLVVTGLDLNGGTLGVASRTSFSAATQVAVGDNPNSVTAADVNGDGRIDLLTANADSNTVSVRLGDGSGGFLTNTEVSAGSGSYAVTTADVNKDGRIDLLTANYLSNSVSVRLGDGDGGFSGSHEVAVGGSPYSVTTTDVNGDGKLDLIAPSRDRNTVSVRLGNGDGSFSGSAEISVQGETSAVATADVNGDGKIDLLAACSWNDTVSVRLGDGNGGFFGTTDISITGRPLSITTADVNGDGRIDLLTANTINDSVSVRLGDGSGNFSGTTEVAVGGGPYSVATADVNGDGRIDIITANYGNSVSVRLGDGDGHFTAIQDISIGGQPVSVTTADVNGDGRIDLLVASSNSDTVSVILNESIRTAALDPVSVAQAAGHDTGFAIDTVSPILTAALAADEGFSSADGVTNDASLSVDAEADSVVTYQVDGGAFGASYDPAAMADGTHSVVVRAIDTAGNVAERTVNFTLDTLAPSVEEVAVIGDGLTDGAGTLTVGQTVGFVLTLSEAVSVADFTGLGLTLDSGGTARFDAGASDATHLVFHYTVRPDETAADLSVTGLVGSATLRDAAGNLGSLAAALGNPPGTLVVDGLIGSSAGEVFHGTSGVDQFRGMGGDDTYVVNDAADLVFESGGGGNDRVLTYTGYALMAGQEIELLATASRSGTGALTLTGNEFDQGIVGDAGYNLIDGGGGADRLRGLGGNDTYLVDDAAVRILEAVGGGDRDSVATSVDYTLLKGQEIEVLAARDATVTTSLRLVGNEFANIIIGNAGANVLSGGGGADTLVGYEGDDTYVVDDAGDLVFEAVGAGKDRVLAGTNFALGDGQSIEVLSTTRTAGTGTIDLTGNALAQTIRGNAGSNVLDGHGGIDVLSGYGGSDTFVFATAPGTGVARITDFMPLSAGAEHDMFQFSSSLFEALAPGQLAESAFKDLGVAGARVDADDRLIYNHDTGVLVYDADGRGGEAAVRVAVLTNKADLSFHDILVV